jgi:hypothetical protein
MTVNIDYSNPYLYEHLTLIVDEFEKGALASGSRVGMVVTAQSPLAGMDTMLASADKALMMRDAPVNQQTNTSSNEDADLQVTPFDIIKGEPDENGIPSVSAQGGIEYDKDLLEIFGDEENPVRKYLEECFDCDFRLQFNWQLKPIDLLGPIGDLVGQINAALDFLQKHLDPFHNMLDLCNLLNGLNFMCLSDWIAILMSLKLLLSSYLKFSIDIKLDWTVILGPLLKVILDAIAQLVQQIGNIIIGPIECAYGAIASVVALQNQVEDTVGAAKAVGQRVSERAQEIRSGDLLGGVDTNIIERELEWENARLRTKDSKRGDDAAKDEEEKTKFPVGFRMFENKRLPDSINDPLFNELTGIEKLALTVKEARDHVKELIAMILTAINSMNGLVAGALQLQIKNLGLLLLIADMISLVMMIISMIKENMNREDWCEYLASHPELWENQLQIKFGREMAAAENSKSTIAQELSQEINKCLNQRSPEQNSLIQQWIDEMKQSGLV